MSERDVDWQLGQIWGKLQRLTEEVNGLMTAQDSVNAAVASIQSVVADLTAAVTNIQAEIAALKAAANVTVDTSGLDTAVAQLQAVQATVDALETPPAPAP